MATVVETVAEPQSEETYVTTQDVLVMLGIAQRTLYDWVRSGRFPAPIRLTRRSLRYRRSDVDRFLAQCRTEAPGASGD